MTYEDAQTVVCPRCLAAVGARCLDPVKDGSRFINHPHIDRVDYWYAKRGLNNPDRENIQWLI